MTKEAFTTLSRRYWEQLFVTAIKVLRGKEEAEDAVGCVSFNTEAQKRIKYRRLAGSIFTGQYPQQGD